MMGPSLKVNKHGLVELNISASSAAELPTDLYNFIRVEGWYILSSPKIAFTCPIVSDNQLLGQYQFLLEHFYCLFTWTAGCLVLRNSIYEAEISTCLLLEQLRKEHRPLTQLPIQRIKLYFCHWYDQKAILFGFLDEIRNHYD